MASGIAHDFNNLLTVVGGNTELLSRLGDERRSILAADISSAATRGAGLTRQLLTTARKQLLEPSNVDVAAFVREVQGLLTRFIGSHIELLVELEDELPSVLAHPSQLEQILSISLSTGGVRMPRGGTLRIAASHAHSSEPGVLGGWVRISVSDTGVGMDVETQKDVFKPFFTTKGASGHGLGLATVHDIVTRSGGRIEVASAPGRGSQFVIHLPAVLVAEQRSRAASLALPGRSQESR